MHNATLTFKEYALVEVVEFFNEEIDEAESRHEMFVAGDTLFVDVIEDEDGFLFVHILPDGEMASIDKDIVEQA